MGLLTGTSVEPWRSASTAGPAFSPGAAGSRRLAVARGLDTEDEANLVDPSRRAFFLTVGREIPEMSPRDD